MSDGMVDKLAELPCVPCTGETAPIDEAGLKTLLHRLGNDWQIVAGHKLFKSYPFADFAGALAFINKVGALAEQVNHHPDCGLAWGRADITIWTHSIGGLHMADFILAAKIDCIQPG
jgi:4a-hydroxytetrahydrobiopterin dehydratase